MVHRCTQKLLTSERQIAVREVEPQLKPTHTHTHTHTHTPEYMHANMPIVLC